MSASGDIMRTSGGYSVHRRDTVMHVGGYHEYIEGCSVHRRDAMIHVGDTMSKSGDVQYVGVFNINQRLLSVCSPT